MPKLWDETIESHRKAVREAALDSAAALVAERGLRAVTMSEIAEKTGIGRATLYKYFSDVEAILAEWHQRKISDHLTQLAGVSDRIEDPLDRLKALLVEFARIQREIVAQHHSQPHGSELAALLHGDEQRAEGQRRLHSMFRDLIADAATSGDVRDDVAPEELATFCVHALGAAGHVPSDDAVNRLVDVTLDGLCSPES